MDNIDLIKGVIVPFFNFFIFMVLLVFFLKKPIQTALRNRAENLQRRVKDSKSNYEAVAAMHEQLKRRFDGLNQEVTTLKANAVKEAQQAASDIISQAQKIAKAIEEDSNRMIQAEMEAATRTLQNEVLSSFEKMAIERFQSDLKHEQQVKLVNKNIQALENLN